MTTIAFSDEVMMLRHSDGMNYCLKNRRLQEQLDEISNGDFSDQLYSVAKLEKKSTNPFVRSRTIYFSLDNLDKTVISVEITPDMIKKGDQYDPNGWNNFPEVDPPLGVLMQCEYYTPEGETARFCATYKRSDEEFAWFGDNEREVYVSSFRPWGYDEEHQGDEVECFLIQDVHPDAIV